MSITKQEKDCLCDDIKILARLIKATVNEEDKEKRLYMGLILEDIGNHLYRDIANIKVAE